MNHLLRIVAASAAGFATAGCIESGTSGLSGNFEFAGTPAQSGPWGG